MEIISDDPYIFTIDNFISDEECDLIINMSKPFMKRAEVSYVTEEEKEKVRAIEYKGRTNTSHWLHYNEHPKLLNICKRVSKILQCDYRLFEKFQVIHYNEGETYNYHYDAWDINNKERYKKYCSERGNRLATVLCYLNDVKEGGGTGFDNLDGYEYIVKAKKGKIVFFTNTNKDGTINEKSRHSGLPVIKGEKWAFNLWLREK